MATLSELLTRALQVYNEQVENMNSNVRIGSLLRDIVNFLDTKQDKESGKGLSTNDFSNVDKANLATLVGLLNDNPDNVLNTISEVFKVLESYPEGVKVVDLLSKKANSEDWNSDAGLVYPATRVYSGNLWRVKAGKTTTAGDVPAAGSDIWENLSTLKVDGREDHLIDEFESGLYQQSTVGQITGLNFVGHIGTYCFRKAVKEGEKVEAYTWGCGFIPLLFVDANNVVLAKFGAEMTEYFDVPIVGIAPSDGFVIVNANGIETEELRAKIKVAAGGFTEFDANAISLQVEENTSKIAAIEESIVGIVTDPVVVGEVLITESNQQGYGGNLITTGTMLQFPESGFLKKITFNGKGGSETHIVIGDVIDNVFYESSRIVDVPGSDGIKNLDIGVFVSKGQYIGILKDRWLAFCINHPALYGKSNFLQVGKASEPVVTEINGGGVGLYYEIEPNPKSLKAEIDGYVMGLFRDGINAPRSGYKQMDANKWITFERSINSFVGTVKKVFIDAESAGSITVGLGIIDQRGWAIIDSQQTFNVVAGLNTLDSQINISENQRLFFKTDLKIGYNSGCKHLESNAGGIVLSASDDEMIFYYEIEGNKIIGSKLATKEEVSNLSISVSDLSASLKSKLASDFLFQSPDGNFWKQVISNLGVITTEKQVPKKITVFGNSIDYHPITDFWWGVWGMAASRREKDWRHQLMSMLYASNGILTDSIAFNIAEWERSADTFDYSQLDSYLTTCELVIIRIGENNPNTTTLTADTTTLINYIKSKTSAPIIFGGVIWTNASKQAKLKAAADSFVSIPFVDFQDLDTVENQCGLGTQVYGDDGVWHTVQHGGVAVHPGDKGHKAMAERLLPYVLAKLE